MLLWMFRTSIQIRNDLHEYNADVLDIILAYSILGIDIFKEIYLIQSAGNGERR